MPRFRTLFVPAIAALSQVFLLDAPASAADEVAAPAAGSTARFSIDYVYATRNTTGDTLIIQDTVTGDPALTTDHFDSRWTGGADARLTFDGPGLDLMLRFLGGFDFEETANVATPAIWNFPTVPPLFGLGVATISGSIESRLDSFEANVGWDVGPQTVLFVGVRNISFDDTLAVNADFGGNVATITWDTSTNGIGPQIGVQSRFGDATFVDVDLRAALLFTHSDMDFAVVQAIGPAFAANGEQSDNAGALEAGIAFGAKIAPSATVKVGYRVLYVANMPTGASSIAQTDVLTPTIGKSSPDFFVHGVTFGIEWYF
jgi:hypothetical protein